MSMLYASVQNTTESLEEVISRAMSRINVKKETDLCQYLPGKSGRLHYFAFNKLKKHQPEILLNMVKEHILEKSSPKIYSSRPKPGLKVKRVVDIQLRRSQINRLVDILKGTGN